MDNCRDCHHTAVEMHVGLAKSQVSSLMVTAGKVRQSEIGLNQFSTRLISRLHFRRTLSNIAFQPQTRTCRVIGSSDTKDSHKLEACATHRTQRLPHQVTSCFPTIISRRFTSRPKSSFQSFRPLRTQTATNQNTMSLQKETLKAGDGQTYPKEGQKVIMEYTGEFESP